jgi:hypothetical protein
MRKRRLLLIVGACLATLSLTVNSALADPTAPPGPPTGPERQLVGVGAETTQGLLNALSDIIKINNTKVIGSYDQSPQPSNITTKTSPPANCVIPRPRDGGTGTDALVKSLQQNDGCVQFSREVSNECKKTSRAGTGLTCIPMAMDALTYAIRSDSQIPKDLSIQNLTDIYNCRVAGIHPLIGSFGAGNRTLFLSKLTPPIADSPTLAGSPGFECLKDTDSNGQPLLANDGRVLTDPTQIVTYSTAPYLAQVNGVISDKHGKAVLGSINGISPTVLNNDSFISREVFNDVATSQVNVEPTKSVFNGSTSLICSNSATIKRQGFNTDPNCGSIAFKTP